jgi:hypothetical protein
MSMVELGLCPDILCKIYLPFGLGVDESAVGPYLALCGWCSPPRCPTVSELTGTQQSDMRHNVVKNYSCSVTRINAR